MELLTAVAGVGGIRGDIIRAAGGRGEDGLATREDRKGALASRGGDGAGGRGRSTGDAAVASPMTRLAAVVAHSLGRRRDVPNRRGGLGRGRGRRGWGSHSKLLEDGPHAMSECGGRARGRGSRDGRVSAEGMKEGLPQRMDPRGWRCSCEKLEKVGLGEGRGDLGPKGGGLLGDALQLLPKSGNFVEGPRGLALNRRGMSERVGGGMVDPATNKLPSPNHLKGLLRRDTKGRRDRRLGRSNINPHRRPPGHETGNVTRKITRGDTLTPHHERASKEGAEVCYGVGARKGPRPLGRGFFRSTPREASQDINCGARLEAKIT